MHKCYRLSKECRPSIRVRKAKPLSRTAQLEQKVDGLTALLQYRTVQIPPLVTRLDWASQNKPGIVQPQDEPFSITKRNRTYSAPHTQRLSTTEPEILWAGGGVAATNRKVHVIQQSPEAATGVGYGGAGK
jgi:hypothetical protein